MLNRSILIGRLTADPDLRKTQSGTSVVSYTLAVNRSRAKEGQQQADFISCVAWDKTADLMVDYTHKGSLIGIVGRIQTRSYQDRDGKNVYVTEVVTDELQFLDPKKQDNSQPFNTKPKYEYNLTQMAERGADNDDLRLDNSDLPF